ncbi:MAG TPA: hypothetical protein DCP03_08995 [Polaromonas sp.]|nr:hypothetical protein [Polaromonas sp.]
MLGGWAMAKSCNNMKVTETSLKYIFGAVLLGAAASSLAVSLGRMRGAAIVGRPFDVTLVAQLSGSEGFSAVCVSADVFFGDNQISPSRVSTGTAVGANANEALIRIRTNSAVDDPVVTVLVREGCSQKTTRKYVLLAEVVTDSAILMPETIGEAAAVAMQQPSTHVTGSKGAMPASRAQIEPATSSPRKKDSGAKGGTVVRRLALPSAGLVAKAAPEPARKSPRSRLKLDPLDLAAERDPVLRASSELLTMPSPDAQQRAAAAALWQALNAQPKDVLRDNQRLKSLEADLANILAQSRKTEKAVEELRVQLEQARSERYRNWLVYTLGAFLMQALLAAIFLWTHSRRQNSEFARSPWWRKGLGSDNEFDMQASSSQEQEPLTPHLKTKPLGEAGKRTESELDLDLNLNVDESLVENLKNFKAPQSAKHFRSIESKDRPDFSPSLTGMPRIVNVEELFDVQQQADFFVTLGDFDKAVEVLRHHITDNVETSALAYLDLFDLYHSLGRKDDYELLRKDFNRIFNAQVPAFDEYTTDTQGLEFYTTALSRIEALWPTPKVLDVIEESIFRKPDSRNEAFSLGAYRELLLLHSIAKKIVGRPAGLGDFERRGPSTFLAPDSSGYSHRTTEFSATNIQPLSAELKDVPARPFVPEKHFGLTQPHTSLRLGLDIDLSRDFDDKAAPAHLSQTKAGEQLPPEQPRNLIDFDLDPLDRTLLKDK